jgi:hypothetical protein
MNFLTTAVPTWVSIFFLVAISISVLMVANLVKNAANQANLGETKANSLFKTVILFFGIYLFYTGVMSFTGIWQENTLPPKILLFTALPLFIFLNLIIANTKIYKTLLANVSLQALVGVHIFRFIGVFFLITNAYGALPTKFAYIAGFGDILTAFFSIFVVKALDAKKSYAKNLTLAWNVFGICDIISVLANAILTTKLSIATGSQGVVEIANFPFCLIPAFAPATIIFLHICVFRKVLEESFN